MLPDSAIVNAALTGPKSRDALAALPVFSGPRMRRSIQVWWDALQKAADLPDSELPGPAASTGLPPAGRWADRDPAAAARLAATRYTLRGIALEHALPAENLLEPALQRKLAWSPPDPIEPRTVADALASGGARPWQVELTADALAAALLDPEPIAAAAQAEAEAARLEAEEAQRALLAQTGATEPAAS